MSSTALMWLVARRELTERLRSKGFILTTAISLVVVIALVIVPSVAGDLFGEGDGELALGVTSDADLPATFEQAVTATAQTFDYTNVELVDLDDRAAAETAIDNGDVDGVVLAPTRLLVGEPDPQLDEFVAQALRGANLDQFFAQADVDPTQLQAASALPDVDVVTLSGQDAGQRETQLFVGLAITILLFLTLQFNGANVLTTTVEEKSSNVVEVLLGTLRPWQLLAGKLISVTVLSVSQMVIYAAGAIVAAVAVTDATLPATTTSAVVAGIAMFLVGFALYASIYAVAGSLAAGAEEAQSAGAPIGFMSAAVYLAVLAGVVPDPDGGFARVLTFIPFTSPFTVPIRSVAGMPAWEAVLAFLITAVTMVGVVRLSGRLYSAAVLSGGRMTWRSAFRAEPIH